MSNLDPRDFIDRHVEQELFGNLISELDSARMLEVCDTGGRGKSSLLRRLRYNCQNLIKPAALVCLIDLNHYSDPAHFALISGIATGVRIGSASAKGRFAKFNQLNELRLIEDFSMFERSGSGVLSHSGTVRGNQVMVAAGRLESDAQMAGYIVKGDAYFEATQRQEFNAEQEQLAYDRCIDAFFDDVRAICAAEPLVILLDGWERCNLELQNWIRDELIGNHLFNADHELRPNRLAMVIASRPYHPARCPHGLRADEFRHCFDSAAELKQAVKSIREFSEWEANHASAFMELNGYPQPTETEIELVRERVAKGVSLEKIASIIYSLRDADDDEG